MKILSSLRLDYRIGGTAKIGATPDELTPFPSLVWDACLISSRTLPAASRREVSMADKIAGIDVHKKVLVVVMDAHAGLEAGAATVRHHAG